MMKLQGRSEDLPMAKNPRAEITRELLLQIVEEGYSRKTWHGPNLRQAIKGVSAKQALWRPGEGRHNIWELVLHAAYWKYAARRKLRGQPKGSFSIAGRDFFRAPDEPDEGAWKESRALLEDEHRQLRLAIGELPANSMAKSARLMWGVAFHDVYHAGQIRLLRRMQPG
jgi:hypothetical protein